MVPLPLVRMSGMINCVRASGAKMLMSNIRLESSTSTIDGSAHQRPSKTVVRDVSGENQFMAVAMVLKTRPGQRRQGELRALLSQLPGACGANPFGCARDQHNFVVHTRNYLFLAAVFGPQGVR